MKKNLLLILFFITSSCFKSDIVQSQTANTDPASMHNGQVYPMAPRSYTSFCNAPKNCKFLFKYDYTFWSDTEKYSSDFSSVRFLILVQISSLFLILIKIIHIVKDGKKDIIFPVK